MKELLPILIGALLGIFIFCATDVIFSVNDPKKEQVGYTYSELQEMKRKCEEDLPRNKQCTILVQYLPQQEAK